MQKGRYAEAAQHYRSWIVWRCPTVRFLDYVKVKDVERAKATELFGTSDAPTALASKVRCPLMLSLPTFLLIQPHQILNIKSRAIESGAGAAPTPITGGSDRIARVKLTETERKRVEHLIRNAKSMQEITRLEKELNEGRVPAGVADGEVMDMS